MEDKFLWPLSSLPYKTTNWKNTQRVHGVSSRICAIPDENVIFPPRRGRAHLDVYV